MGQKVNTIRRVCIERYRIVFSFHLAKRISHPDRFSKETTKSLVSGTGFLESNELGESKIAGERAKLPGKFDPGQDIFSGVTTGSRQVCRPCYRTYGNLIKTSVREKSRGVYLPIGRVFPSYLKIFRSC